MGNKLASHHRQRLLTVALAIAALAFGLGVWLGYIAWKRDSLTFGVSAMLLLLDAPILALAAILARDSVLHAAARKSANLLIDDLARADSALRFIRLARAHMGVAASYAFVLWVCQSFGLISAWDFVVYSTFIIAAAVAGYLPWFARQEKRVHVYREASRRQLDEIKATENWFAG